MEPIRPSPCTRASLTLLSDLQHGPPEVLHVSHPGHNGFSQVVSHVEAASFSLPDLCSLFPRRPRSCSGHCGPHAS